MELLGAAAVFGGFGGGDVEERLEVGGGGGGGVGVLLELGFECGGAILCVGFGGGAPRGLLVELFLEAVDLGADPGRVVSGGRARLFEFTLEPVGTLAVFRRLGGGDVDERLEIGGGSGGGIGVLLELRFECGGALARLAGCGVRRVAFSLEFLSPVAVLHGFSGSDVDQRLEIRRSAGGLFALLVEALLEGLEFALRSAAAASALAARSRALSRSVPA